MSDLDDVKPGDKVAHLIGYAGRNWTITTVERLTATQIVTANGRRWWRKNGREVGGYTQIQPVTPEIVEAIRIARARRTIDKLVSGALTDEEAVRVAEAIKAALKEQPND